MVDGKRIIIVIIIFFLAFCGTSSDSAIASTTAYVPSYVYPFEDALILIDGNSDLEEYPGNGTWSDPFRIELHFLSAYSNGVCIRNVDAYVRICNCTISFAAPIYTGIWIKNSSNIQIENCHLIDTRFGITTEDLTNLTIKDCTISKSIEMALSLHQVVNSQIDNFNCTNIGKRVTETFPTPPGGSLGQTVTYNTGKGIELDLCENASIERFRMDNSPEAAKAISVVSSANIESSNITVDTIEVGLYIDDSINCTLKDNEFDNTALEFRGDIPMMICEAADNTLNGKALGIFINQDGGIIEGASYESVYLINCTDVVLDGGTYRNCNPVAGIWDSTNCTIVDAIMDSTLWIDNSCNSTIDSCTINIAGEIIDDHAIIIKQSESIKVTNCEIIEQTPWNWGRGIFFETVMNCTAFKNNIRGMSGISLFDATNCTVLQNEMVVYRGGLAIKDSEQSVIGYNWIEKGHLQIVNSQFLTIVNNTIVGSDGYGLYLDSHSENNRIFYNIIGWHIVNAGDEGTNNIWDDGVSRGNNWSDYVGSGEYVIHRLNGTSNGVDRYPSGIDSGYWTPPSRGVDMVLIILFTGSISLVAITFYVLWRSIKPPLKNGPILVSERR